MSELEAAIAAYIAAPSLGTFRRWHEELLKASPSMRKKSGEPYALRRRHARRARDKRRKSEA